jgi:hypothetical protein
MKDLYRLHITTEKKYTELINLSTFEVETLRVHGENINHDFS